MNSKIRNQKSTIGMCPGETVSKLRSTPAPYLAQAPAPKLGIGIDLNRDRVRVSCLLGPDTVLTRSHLTEVRTRHHRGARPTSSWWSAQRTLRNFLLYGRYACSRQTRACLANEIEIGGQHTNSLRCDVWAGSAA